MIVVEPVQSPLFDQTPLSGWLPDETLYSWCSRYHLVSSNHLPASTTKALFEHRYLGSAHDFPCRIDYLVERTRGDLGSAGSIISGHTILPVFLPFQNPWVAQMALATMRGPSTSSLKYRLGLLTSHFRAHFPLKACPECISQDRTRYGIAYWHRSHQLPGAWVCIQHGQLLQESTLKATGAQRFGWVLPEGPYFRPVSFKPSHAALQQLTQLAIAANELAHIQTGWHFNSETMANALRERLQQNGLASPSSRLKTQTIGREFHAFIWQLHGIDEFHAITVNEASATAQACGYFHRMHRVTHPLRHLLMITWLYQDWAAFMEDYQTRSNCLERATTSVTAEQLDHATAGLPVNTLLRDACVRLSTIQRLSATAIANQLGVTVATVMAHLSATGIQTPKRPKLLRGTKPEELRAALRHGVSKQEASQQFGVSVGTVTRFLLSEVGLHQEWTRTRHELNQQYTRGSWSALLSGNQAATLKLLRSIEPDTYAWLYRNDREWLKSANQSRLSRPYSGGRSVNWEIRDQQMIALTQVAIDGLLQSNPNRYIHMTDLLQLVPQLKPFINKLDTLPRTQFLLNQCVQRRSRNTEDLFKTSKTL